MLSLESKIESVLLFKNEPVSIVELGKWLGVKPDAIKEALTNLTDSYKSRGLVIISDKDSVTLGTHPEASELIENLQKEELSRELGRAGLETLAIVLYKGPITRREIDHIRGVNSSFILRSLLIRGLVERVDPSTSLGQVAAGRSYSYKATLKLLQYLGITRIEDLPEFENSFKKIEEFEKTVPVDSAEQNG